MSYRQLNRYQCPDRDKDTILRRITRLSSRLHPANILKEMQKATATTGGSILAHFENAVYDEDTGQMLDYKKLIHHNNKELLEWWQQLSANKFGKLMKGAGQNADRTHRVKGSDTFHFICIRTSLKARK